MNNKIVKKFCVGKVPEQTLVSVANENSVRESARYAELVAETASAKFIYYCSLCLIIRDESEYLEEWLRWHIAQGVEHFYIYDHGSKHPVLDFVRSLGGEISERTEVIDWSGSHKDAQPDAYNDCLRRARGVSRWVGFIDADEHVRVNNGKTMSEFLKNYEKFAGVFANWVTYGANGHVTKSIGPLRERFTKVSHYDKWADVAGKLITQPIYMAEMIIHNGRAEPGFDIVDEHCRKIKDYMLIIENATHDYICVDHYYTKSYEEWLAKLRRGSGDAKFFRKYKDFFIINPDMDYCRKEINIPQLYEKFN